MIQVAPHRSQNKFIIDSEGHAKPKIRREPDGLQCRGGLVFELGIFVALLDFRVGLKVVNIAARCRFIITEKSELCFFLFFALADHFCGSMIDPIGLATGARGLKQGARKEELKIEKC